jgi:hypothetical protein
MDLARAAQSLDEEHRQIRNSYPRLLAALDVTRAVNKLSSLRGSRSGTASGAGAGPGNGAAATMQPRSAAATAESAAAAAPAAALQAHCRSVVEQLEAAVCEEMLAAGCAPLLSQRPMKRPRTGAWRFPVGALSASRPSRALVTTSAPVGCQGLLWEPHRSPVRWYA